MKKNGITEKEVQESKKNKISLTLLFFGFLGLIFLIIFLIKYIILSQYHNSKDSVFQSWTLWISTAFAFLSMVFIYRDKGNDGKINRNTMFSVYSLILLMCLYAILKIFNI